jgi:hypothetical protein
VCCNGSKNQTPDVVFDGLKSAGVSFRDGSIVGIGVFVVPAPERGILEYRVVHVEGLSYDETMKRGSHCEAFQWIPQGVTFEAEGRSFSIEKTSDLEALASFCNDSCRGGCPMGCVCFTGDVRCRQNW